MPRQYPNEVRERAVRLVLDHRGDYETEYSAKPTMHLRSPCRVRRVRLIAIWLVAALLGSACSVAVPRDGWTGAQGLSGGPPGAEGQVPGAEGQVPGAEGQVPGAEGQVPGAEGQGTGASGRSSSSSGTRSAPGAAAGENRGSASKGTGGGSAQGVSDSTVNVAVIGGFGGPYGPAMNDMYGEGFQPWVDDVNARGGVHGRKVVIKKIDHKETTSGGVGACKEAISSRAFLVFTIQGQGEANNAAADCLDKAGVTNLAYSGEHRGNWRHTYTFLPTAVEQGRSLGSFVRNVMGDGEAKLGVIYLSLPTFVKAQQAYVAKAKALGMNVVRSEQIQPGQSSFTSQLLRLKEAGATNVAIIAVTEAIGILRDAKGINYQPRWTGTFWTFDFITAAARDTAKGAMGLGFSATKDSPAYERWERVARKHGASTKFGRESMLFYGLGLLLERVLTAAGPRPTSTTLVSGLRSIDGYNNQILPPISFKAGSHGAHASYPTKCCASDWSWQSLGQPAEKF